MDHVDIKLLLNGLQRAYRTEYNYLQTEYQTQHRQGRIKLNQTEDEYILEHMSQLLATQTHDFVANDKSSRVSAILPLFCAEKYDVLVKKRYPTGYQRLDEALDGGFVPGVHYIGAISSLGKSTFALQLADQMASRRINAVYVSLEMSREDIVAKLVSMHTFTDVGERQAKTATELTSTKLVSYTAEDWATVHEAVGAIAEHAEYITIKDARARGMNVDQISKYIQDYYRAYNVAPVLIVDYLQILDPAEGMNRYTDKQVVDYNVAEFRTLAAEYDIPVIIISSFNRDSYDLSVSLKSFKESGNIEYSSDTLIGLQLQGIGSPDFDVDKAKAAPVRKVELVILKQRYGRSGIKIGYDFYTYYNYFEEQKVPAAQKAYHVY